MVGAHRGCVGAVWVLVGAVWALNPLAPTKLEVSIKLKSHLPENSVPMGAKRPQCALTAPMGAELPWVLSPHGR